MSFCLRNWERLMPVKRTGLVCNWPRPVPYSSSICSTKKGLEKILFIHFSNATKQQNFSKKMYIIYNRMHLVPLSPSWANPMRPSSFILIARTATTIGIFHASRTDIDQILENDVTCRCFIYYYLPLSSYSGLKHIH